MCAPASIMTGEVDAMVMFWQILYGLPVRVHVTICPGVGIGASGFRITASVVESGAAVVQGLTSVLE